MGKKKWIEERETILQRILDYCELNLDVDIHGEDYKRDFLKICADAYKRRFCGEEWGHYPDDPNRGYVLVEPKRPQIDGWTIWQFAEDAGLVTSEMDPADERYETVRQVMDWWDAWVYAWDHQPKKRLVDRKLKHAD